MATKPRGARFQPVIAVGMSLLVASMRMASAGSGIALPIRYAKATAAVTALTSSGVARRCRRRSLIRGSVVRTPPGRTLTGPVARSRRCAVTSSRSGRGRGGHSGGELPWAFQRQKMPAVDLLQPYMDEELVETVGPCGREQRVVVGPQHRGRHGN